MAKYDLQNQILAYLQQQLAAGMEACGPEAITANVEASRPTVNRFLARMAAAGNVRKVGSGPATRYALPAAAATAAPAGQVEYVPQPVIALLGAGFQFSPDRQLLIAELTAPIGTRKPVTYQRAFVESYVPNETSLLPPALAADLFARGRTDADDVDTLMLLNHKEALEFGVDAVPEYGITEAVVRNIQALLMQGLLSNPDALGKARRTVVTITDSVYVPMKMPQILDEMLALLIEKVRNIKNPIEAAFFLWVNIAYLQPFEDGNKRTSRLCANLPLLLQNCAPLSFLDVEQADYAMAILGIYEKQDVTLAAELFAWTYQRSITKYAVILDSMGAPDLFRQRYRELLGEGVRRVVADGAPIEAVVKELEPPFEDLPAFLELLRQELSHLEAFNCARYRLGIRLTEIGRAHV